MQVDWAWLVKIVPSWHRKRRGHSEWLYNLIRPLTKIIKTLADRKSLSYMLHTQLTNKERMSETNKEKLEIVHIYYLFKLQQIKSFVITTALVFVHTSHMFMKQI